MSFAQDKAFMQTVHPEVAIGGFTAHDGTIEFYSRVKTLLRPDMTVLDFGAGRGAWYEDEESPFRRDMRLLRGHAREVIGCDVDPAVQANRSVDRGVVLEPGRPIPLADGSVDLIVSDYVLEHVQDAAGLAREFTRILKPGGWICARTPTRMNYVALAARVVANVRHASVLRLAQPGRKAEDVFPTAYQLNTRAALARHFPASLYENYSYIYCFEPQYHFRRTAVYRFFRLVHWLLPPSLQGNLYIFLRRRAPGTDS